MSVGPPFKIIRVCKGGGYRYARTEPLHPKSNAKGLYPLHRVLMENKLGRLLLPSEIVHHKDENKENDNIDNLEVKTNSEHSRDHTSSTAETVSCAYCLSSFELKPHVRRLRIRRNKSGLLFCSYRCGALFQSAPWTRTTQ